MESEIKPFNRTLVKAACAAFALATLVSSMTVFAQRDRDGYAIAVCQDALRERIVREQGGSDAKVNFDRPQVTYDSYGMRCSGSGVFMRDFNDRGRRFTYDALIDLPDGDVSKVTYRFEAATSIEAATSTEPATTIAVATTTDQRVEGRVPRDERSIAGRSSTSTAERCSMSKTRVPARIEVQASSSGTTPISLTRIGT
jgi:hypothetical protein